MCSSDRMSEPVGEVGAVGAVNAADLSTEFQPSTPEFDFGPEGIAMQESVALAALARTPVASASVSATPVAAASRAVSSANALRRATPAGDSSSVLRLRRGLGPRIPLNLAASASNQRGLFSSSSSAPHNQNNQGSPRKNTKNASRNRTGGSRKKRTYRKKRTQRKQTRRSPY